MAATRKNKDGEAMNAADATIKDVYEAPADVAPQPVAVEPGSASTSDSQEPTPEQEELLTVITDALAELSPEQAAELNATREAMELAFASLSVTDHVRLATLHLEAAASTSTDPSLQGTLRRAGEQITRRLNLTEGM